MIYYDIMILREIFLPTIASGLFIRDTFLNFKHISGIYTFLYSSELNYQVIYMSEFYTENPN